MLSGFAANASPWQRGEDHPLARLHRRVTTLPREIVATYDEVLNIQYINATAFDTLTESEKNAVYRRTQTVYADHEPVLKSIEDLIRDAAE